MTEIHNRRRRHFERVSDLSSELKESLLTRFALGLPGPRLLAHPSQFASELIPRAVASRPFRFHPLFLKLQETFVAPRIPASCVPKKKSITRVPEHFLHALVIRTHDRYGEDCIFSCVYLLIVNLPVSEVSTSQLQQRYVVVATIVIAHNPCDYTD